MALGLLTVIIIFSIWRMFDFADAHPEVAVLEGAELLHLREIQLAQKGRGEIPVTPSEASDFSAPALTGSDAALILPDPIPEGTVAKRRRSDV